MIHPDCAQCIEFAQGVTARARKKRLGVKILHPLDRESTTAEAKRLVAEGVLRCKPHDIEFLNSLTRPFTDAEKRRAIKYLDQQQYPTRKVVS